MLQRSDIEIKKKNPPIFVSMTANICQSIASLSLTYGSDINIFFEDPPWYSSPWQLLFELYLMQVCHWLTQGHWFPVVSRTLFWPCLHKFYRIILVLAVGKTENHNNVHNIYDTDLIWRKHIRSHFDDLEMDTRTKLLLKSHITNGC